MFDVAVLDASPLIVLAKAGQLPLLRAVAATSVAPPAVVAEVLAGRSDAAAEALLTGLVGQTGMVVVPAAVQVLDLGAGELDAISYALLEPDKRLLVLDDRDARSCAQALGVNMTGCVGVVVAAKRAALITDVEQTLLRLQAAGLYLTPSLIQQAVRAGGGS